MEGQYISAMNNSEEPPTGRVAATAPPPCCGRHLSERARPPQVGTSLAPILQLGALRLRETQAACPRLLQVIGRSQGPKQAAPWDPTRVSKG